MGMDARNPCPTGYMKSSNHESSQSSQQQVEAGSPVTQSLTVEQLSLSLEAVTRKVSMIEGRMSVLEASFEVLLQKTAELKEELRLTHEQLAIRNQGLILLERSTDEDKDLLEQAECLRIGNLGDIGER